MKQSLLSNEFVQQSVFRMNEFTPRIKSCLDALSEAEVWQRPNQHSNSIGNLILHLSGNIRQWISATLGGEEDVRDRVSEFEARDGFSRQKLIKVLEDTVSAANKVIFNMSDDTLLQHKTVQGFDISGLGNILHVVEHYSYHTGQIAFYTKAMKNSDLAFYAGKDLNEKNTNG